ncbi:MAG: DUF6516 family protein, partial [Methanosarcinales archaeon]
FKFKESRLIGLTGSYIKMVITFKDLSTLRVTELKKNGILDNYSYYWLDIENKILIGWDNAEHHKNIDTYPHHRHLGSKENVLPSTQRSLDDVLQYISRIM